MEQAVLGARDESMEERFSQAHRGTGSTLSLRRRSGPPYFRHRRCFGKTNAKARMGSSKGRGSRTTQPGFFHVGWEVEDKLSLILADFEESDTRGKGTYQNIKQKTGSRKKKRKKKSGKQETERKEKKKGEEKKKGTNLN